MSNLFLPLHLVAVPIRGEPLRLKLHILKIGLLIDIYDAGMHNFYVDILFIYGGGLSLHVKFVLLVYFS
jgi:hypothetical protein